MGSSESKTQEILTNKIQTMTGKEVLEAAGGIQPLVTITTHNESYVFGDVVSGSVKLKLNKPIFFVEEGLVQLTLEGKEIFQQEELIGSGHQAQKQGPPQTLNHVDKFFRMREILYDQKNTTQVFEYRAKLA